MCAGLNRSGPSTSPNIWKKKQQTCMYYSSAVAITGIPSHSSGVTKSSKINKVRGISTYVRFLFVVCLRFFVVFFFPGEA